MSNPVFLNRTMLNLTWPLSQDMMLHKGEVLQGQVRGFTADGLVLLCLKGQMIEAATEIMVETGQTLHLVVDDVKQGQAYLKLLTPATIEKAEVQTIAARLMDLGLPARAENIEIARALSDYQLPVTRSNVEAVYRGCTQLGAVTPQNMNQLAFQISKGIPMIQPILAALSQYTSQSSSLSELVYNILTAVREAAVTTPILNEAPGQLNIQSVMSQVVNSPVAGHETQEAPVVSTQPTMSASVPISGEGQPPIRSEQVVPLPTSVEHITPQSTGGDAASTRTSSATVPADRALLIRTLNWLPRLLEALALNPGEEPVVIAGKMRDIGGSQPDIIRSLSLVRDILQTETTAPNHLPTLSLAGKVDDLVREFTGQQVMNANPQRMEANTPMYYFAFPVQIDQDIQLCQLRINGDTSSDKLAQRDQVNVVVSLDTARMGTVLYHVAWHAAGGVEIQGVVESDGVRRYLDSYTRQLTQALEEQGYRVTNLGIKVVPADQANAVLKILPQPEANRSGLIRVDITV